MTLKLTNLSLAERMQNAPQHTDEGQQLHSPHNDAGRSAASGQLLWSGAVRLRVA